MTKAERWKLDRLRAEFGVELTIDEALELAINAEKIKKDCGPCDPAYLRFATEQQALETMALLMEKESAERTVVLQE